MTSLRKTAIAVSLACALPAAHAQGIPVIDVAALTQAMQQVLAWGKQYTQMADQLAKQAQQIRQLEATHASMTGSRGLGLVANGVGAGDVVPTDVHARLSRMRTLAGLVEQVKVLADGGLSGTQARAAQIQLLMRQIDATIDAKGAAEIQARIQAEGAMVANEANRIALMQMQERAEAERIQAEIRARNNANAVSTARTTVDFTGAYRAGR